MAQPGRPRLDTEALTLRLPAKTIAEIDDLRRAERDIPTRPEMVRRLIGIGINAQAGGRSDAA